MSFDAKTYKDLIVWQKSVDFVSVIYDITKSFPNSEQFGITNQIRRASVSVSLNIAEGWGRKSNKSFAQFLKISRGSLYEVETISIISNKLKYLNNEQFELIRISV
ncbi:MAG: hypothetical protein A2W98_01085 [Bacteroidetes bacterium GWF2_33_38]|nr:MAG: hypothetical protein A2W98_01085 [Bacteroidetes bacterium GWF2_33_38]OFY74661.1 MAG: hypothetical protein A2265_01585 [Bacteroidetes bacterium RIFOXYA12_FULL_33_9]OFY91641.1 MAG: hypothetical protein A2236_09420 [Bacteroidetes bacterium RIFOXYA2_FULL_33_7]HBX50612.1 four helix bundle protein [Bacteroidales bacterium]